MVYLISRHPGAVDWILANTSLKVDKIVTHLDSAEELVEGDIIIGTLPTNMIANVISKGARYIHLVVPVGQHLRGQELTKEQMDT
ncbi:CRISPR-associated protein Csx16, partial [Francisella philomiragia]